jgi:hypothetical protein
MRKSIPTRRVNRRRFLLTTSATLTTIALLGCGPSDSPLPNASRSPANLAARAALEPPRLPAFPLDVEFGRGLRLDGVSLARRSLPPGTKFRLWLYWTAIAQCDEDLRSVGSLFADGGRILAREDDQIGGHRHVLSVWAMGERNVDEMEISVARKTPEGEYLLGISVLRADRQTAVPVSSRTSHAVAPGEAAVAVTTIAVAQA